MIPLKINVAQQLKEPVGSTRTYRVEELEQPAPELHMEPVEGEVQLLKLDRSILVRGQLNTGVRCECSRCLSDALLPLHFLLEEEFFPTVDVITGLPLPPPEDGQVFTMDRHHILDLTEAVRQYTILNTPMKPLCKPSCAGLCPTCGTNLNERKCLCSASGIDPRWAALEKLRKES